MKLMQTPHLRTDQLPYVQSFEERVQMKSMGACFQVKKHSCLNVSFAQILVHALHSSLLIVHVSLILLCPCILTASCDLQFKMDKDRFGGRPLFSEKFPSLWSGSRATHGITEGKVYYEVKVRFSGKFLSTMFLFFILQQMGI